MPSTVWSADRDIRTQKPRPGQGVDTQVGLLLPEARSKLKTLWADGAGGTADGWEDGGG